MSRPANWPADKPWPPHVATAPMFPVDGVIEVVGQLDRDAEMRVGANGRPGALIFEIGTGRGFPYEVIQQIPAGANDLQAATTLQRALRRGTSVRVTAHGCLPRTDHGKAVLQLLEVTTVVPI